MKNNLIIAIVCTAIISGGAGFYGGMKYQTSKNPAFVRNLPQNFESRMGQNDQSLRNGGFRPVSGEILSFDDQSLTVKLADESSKIIILTDTSKINITQEGNTKDLKVGENISVFGQENSDGSVTAQNIQIGNTIRQISPTEGEQN